MVKQQHIRLDDEVYRKLKVKAAANDKSVNGYIEDLVTRHVKDVKIPKDWVEAED